MFLTSTRAALLTSLALGLSACVPTTTTQKVTVAQPVALPTEIPAADQLYLASKDNGISIPAIPTEKIPEQFRRQVVDYVTDEAPGTVVIYPGSKHLYFVTGDNKAIRYGIAVGAAGFQWSGEALVTNRRQWPTWTPPPEMIERKPSLAKWAKGQPGGPTNPMGSRALYLTTNGVDHGYRIHGTPEWWSIGKNASSGCIRMINQDVMDLYNRVQPNAKVIVMTASGERPKGLTLPPPQPKKKKEKPAEVVTPVATTAVDAPAAPATTPALSVPSTINDAPVGTPPALQAPAAPAAPQASASDVGATAPAAAEPAASFPAATPSDFAAPPATAAPIVTAPVVTPPSVATPAAPIAAPVLPKVEAPVAQ